MIFVSSISRRVSRPRPPRSGFESLDLLAGSGLRRREGAVFLKVQSAFADEVGQSGLPAPIHLVR